MKIGAGGLQSLIVYDAMPQRSPAEAQAKVNQTMNMEMGLAGAAVNRKELIKALEKLKNSSKMYNLTYEFLLAEESEEVYIAVVDKKSGKVMRRLSPDKFLADYESTGGFSGVMLDSQR
ncbi:flagellar protein FlaG [Pelotomaculum isophthalicicum JI]|uniref:Flagellar protein FlaG n=1 Tax=Pelotomaculum isophthalicicum JI TaxID=947010 RepID=A0A9X4H3J3_9FIRM|nr:flagellar protein FlaG [Pelotomaculum isophthalicicum]MDF9409136.1 flagellar protein FlaG [Pelotomaculum isophthalicicum JI]